MQGTYQETVTSLNTRWTLVLATEKIGVDDARLLDFSGTSSKAALAVSLLEFDL